MTRTESSLDRNSTGGDASGAGGGGAGVLRLALAGDAVATGATSALLLAARGLLDGLLGLPSFLLWMVGLFLAGYAAAVGYLASQPRINRGGVLAVIVLNLVWALDSVLVLMAGGYPVTALGTAFVLAQAVAVVLFADLQILGLKRQAA
jgi:hypothetical protein